MTSFPKVLSVHFSGTSCGSSPLGN